MADISGLSNALDQLAASRRLAIKQEIQRVKDQRRELVELERFRKQEAKDARTLERQTAQDKRAIRGLQLREESAAQSRRNAELGEVKEKSRLGQERRTKTKFSQGQEDRREKARRQIEVDRRAARTRRRQTAQRKTEGVSKAAKLQKTFLPAGFASPEEKQGEAALQTLLDKFQGQLQPGSAQQLFKGSTAGQRTTISDASVQALTEQSGLSPFEIANVAPEGQQSRLTSLINRIVAQSSKEKELNTLANQFGFGGGANPELETARLEGLVGPEFQGDPRILDLIKKLQLAKSLGTLNQGSPAPAQPESKGGVLDFLFR